MSKVVLTEEDVLAALAAHGGVRTLGELAAELGAHAPSLRILLHGLEDRRLIGRREMVLEGGALPVWWAPAPAGRAALAGLTG